MSIGFILNRGGENNFQTVRSVVLHLFRIGLLSDRLEMVLDPCYGKP